MKKVYITLSLAVAMAVAASAQTKFDAASLGAISHYKDLKQNPATKLVTPLALPFEINNTARSSEIEAGVIIKLNPGETFDSIEAAGLKIMATVGDDMCVASGSMDDIIALEDVQAVQALSLGSPVDMYLDKARAASGVTEVHNGTELPQAYKGTGIICGIFDSGIDPNHINFYDAAFTNTRVKAVYNTPNQNGSITAYETPEDVARFTTDNRNGTHGTHTLGCMTGAFNRAGNAAATSGYPTGSCAIYNETTDRVTALSSTKCAYYGTAPDADIVVGCGQLYNPNIIAAVTKIVDYAKAKKQPAVVNISLGSVGGPHDGSDLIGQAFDRLSKDAIICVAAGNEGEDNISIVKNLTAADKELKSLLTFSSASQGILSIYGSDKNPFKFSLAVIDKTTGEIKAKRDYNTEGSFTLATSNYTNTGYQHETEFDNAFSSSYAIVNVSDNKGTTGRHGISMQYVVNRNVAKNPNYNLVLAVLIEGNAGQRIEIVNQQVSGNANLASNGLAGYSDGTNEFTINDMACSPNVLCVGSWTSRVKWGTVGRAVYSYNADANLTLNEVSPFTSFGVLYNGRSLPDICAPGAGIVSSYNSYFGSSSTYDVARYTYKDRTYVWQAEQGTSMATPFLAGVVATWLQADPSLTVSKVRDILKKTADPLVGNSVQTGAGKLNAYNGLKEVLGLGAVNDVKIEDDILVKVSANEADIYVTGGNINATVYSLNGQPVKNIATPATSVTIDLSVFAKGLYILNVNGTHTEKILVK